MKAGWAVKSLGEVSDFQGGSQPPKSNFVDQPREGYVRLLQIRDFKSDKWAIYVPIAKSNKLCQENDIMIGRYGASVGQIHRGKGGAYNVALIRTIPNLDLIDREFFYRYLNSDLFQKPLLSVADRSAQAGFSKDDIAPFLIPLPPLDEQRRIVAVLDKAFAGIATATANAQTNLANARALFESYLRSVFDTPNTEWHRTTLGKLTTKIGSGATPRGGKEAYQAAGTPLIRSMNVHDRFFKEHNLAFINDGQAKLLNNVVVQQNDVLLNITGASVARCCIVPDQWTNGRVNQHVAIIRADAATIRPQFIELALTSPYYKDILLGVGEKGGSTRQAITKADIQKLEIAFPDLARQDSFVDHATSLQIETRKFAEIAKQKINALTELKQSLLQKAFTGELT